MLGRQQIAGIPTAIHELFKNAHDAYAETVSVDYFRSDALFVLRDDGIGMTEQDFEQRWLTVGTDSKVEKGTLPLLLPQDVQAVRPVLGEKGIGRLAIATIGPLVLVLTRSRRPNALNGVTGALVHWGFFEIPGLDVDDIDIPVIPLGKSEAPGDALIGLLKEGALRNIDMLRGKAPDGALDKIKADVEGFALDLPSLYEEIGPSTLDRDGDQGTHFFVLPADRIIESDMDDAKDDVASSLTRSLLGFSNTMVPGAPRPPIVASFTDHRLDGVTEELIGSRAFFTPEEFEEADHHVAGQFDEFGQFRGTVAVYGQAPTALTAAWANPAGIPTECGPFKLDFAYVQGASRESRLDPDQYARISDKLTRIGGLYLYRDGVRILPYGNSDYDFLDVERRRTKGAGYYFFSFRRMFGAIQTTRAANGSLVEKAGREGFQENRAYRQFKQLLESLLIQIAADFFREGGIHTDAFERIKSELERNEEVRRARGKQARTKRVTLARDLKFFFDRVETDVPAREAARLSEDAARRARSAASVPDGERAAVELLKVEADVRRDLVQLQEDFRVSKPKGFGLTKPLLRDWGIYREQASRLEKQVFAPLAIRVDQVFGDAIVEFAVPLDQRRRVNEAIQDTASRAAKELGALARATVEESREVQAGAAASSRQAVASLEALLQEVRAEFASTPTSSLTDARTLQLSQRMQDRITAGLEHETSLLGTLRTRLAAVHASDAGSAATAEELTEAMEEHIESLREEIELYVELAQMGMAVGIVQHDFAVAIDTIRSSIRALLPWAKANKDLARLHSSLRTAFEHLDGYLNLFTPISRRLYRTKIPILGEQIIHFIDGVFAERLAGSDVKIVATDAFRRHEIEGYPSTFFPVFANLVDNARYWIEHSGVKEGRISLGVDGKDFLISDNGPGIQERDRSAIFEYGWTRKAAGGQGLGLFISRQVLKRVDWELRLDPREEGSGATFRMVPPPDQTADTADGRAPAETT